MTTLVDRAVTPSAGPPAQAVASFEVQYQDSESGDWTTLAVGTRAVPATRTDVDLLLDRLLCGYRRRMDTVRVVVAAEIPGQPPLLAYGQIPPSARRFWDKGY